MHQVDIHPYVSMLGVDQGAQDGTSVDLAMNAPPDFEVSKKAWVDIADAIKRPTKTSKDASCRNFLKNRRVGLCGEVVGFEFREIGTAA